MKQTRWTKERQKIFDFLKENHLIGSKEIIDNFPEIGRASVFRNLKFFCENGIARKVILGDLGERYEFIHEEKHEHMICNSCGKIENFDSEFLDKFIEKIGELRNFDVKNSFISVSGSCNNCK